MPGPDGSLTDTEVAVAHLKLQEYWAMVGGRKPCPQCGDTHYFVMPQLNGNRSDTPTTNTLHFRFPAVMVACQRCGFLDQFFAPNLGISWLPAPVQTDEPPAPPESLGDILSNALRDRGGENG